MASRGIRRKNSCSAPGDGSPNNYFPTFAGNRRPNAVGPAVSIRDNFRDTGGDRFNVQNINSVFTGGQNGLDSFAYPAAFTVGNLGRNTTTGVPLLSESVGDRNYPG